MRIVYAIFKKEMNGYLLSPLAYAIIAVVLGLAGYFFSVNLFVSRIADLTGLFMNLAVILIFASPMLTMKLMAGEEQEGTMEFLLTSPITIPQLVIGKYLASLGLFLILIVMTLIFPGILVFISTPDKGVILTSYLGFFLLAAMYLAVGIMCSSFTGSQLIAGMSGFGILLIMWVMGWLSGNMSGPLEKLARNISIPEHYGDFLRGIVDTTHITYFLSIIAFSLIISMIGVAKKTWS
ncbi:ABC transporter permease [Thermoanaerobacterium sp. DL9XJH110]|uniref:ABC transporter permease n=1 Tax=Thermoanaerobacterium sp. DL9XJH110 TaxID=3386643 RepID=UPI003BB66651